MSPLPEPGPEVPRSFGERYAIEALLGRGPSSAVYRARDARSGQTVALKVLDPRLCWDPQAVERLRREVIVSRRIQHPGVVRVHDLVTDGGASAIVQELVEGDSVATLLAREGALSVPRAITVAEGVLEALAACHEKGVLHRDIRPSNVLMAENGRVCLIDFGIARVSLMTTVTHIGALLGAPGYQAPEVLRGERPDLRCDLYGVGILLFEMLTGRAPFGRPGEEGPLFAQLAEVPPDIAASRPVPPGLAALVRQLLDPHPELRPAGAWEVIEALRDLDSVELSRLPGLECGTCTHVGRSATIPFCAGCGRIRRIVLRPGRWFVRLRGVDRVMEYVDHLVEVFGAGVSVEEARRRLDPTVPSCIVARGLSKESANALAADARQFGGGSEVGEGLGWLQLTEGVSSRVLVLGLAGCVFVVLGLALMLLSLVQRTFGAGLGGFLPLTLGFGLFLALGVLLVREARPILDPRRVGSATKPTKTGHLAQKLAGRVAQMRPGLLRTPMAGAIEAYWEALRASGDVGALAMAKSLEQVLERVLRVVQRAGPVISLLEGRGPADAAKDLERVQARQRASSAPVAELIALEAAVRDELQALEAADDLISAASGRLVLAAGLFRHFAREVAAAHRPALGERLLEEFVGQADLELEALERALESAKQRPVEGRSSPAPA